MTTLGVEATQAAPHATVSPWILCGLLLKATCTQIGLGRLGNCMGQLLCTYLKPTELGVISRDRTRVAEQINPSTIDHRSTRERAGTVSPGQSSAIKQEGARAR